jgi:arylsulfatase A-like enzyme
MAAQHPLRTRRARALAAFVVAAALGCSGEARDPLAAPTAPGGAPGSGASVAEDAPERASDPAAAAAAAAADPLPGAAARADRTTAREPSAARAADGPRPPDVLLISIDTLRADALSCYGNPWSTSPLVDSLARRGVRFAQAFAPAPHTAPSHMTLFTGLLPAAHGISNQGGQYDHVKALAAAWPTLTSLFAEAGWQVAVAAEGGQLRAELGFFSGAHDVDLSSRTFADTIANFRRFVRGAERDRPLFAFLHTYQVHAPYVPPLEVDGTVFHGRFTSGEAGGMFRARYEVLRRRAEHDASQASRFLDDFPGRTAADVEFLRGLYHENVAYMDHQLARALGVWDRERGLADSIVVLVSDHGEQLGERGAFGHREGLEPELTHVPLIVCAPGLAPRVVQGPVGLANVPATLLELVGLAVPPHMEPSLTEALRGGAALPDAVHQQDTLGAGDALGVVRGGHQWIGGRARGLELDVLYDLVVDPAGTTPVSDRAPLADELRALASARRTSDEAVQARVPYLRLPLGASADDLERLRFLGYVEEEQDE